MSKNATEVINEFQENGIDTSEYREIVNDLLISYTKEEEYITMKKQERAYLVQRCREIKELLKNIGGLTVTACLILIFAL